MSLLGLMVMAGRGITVTVPAAAPSDTATSPFNPNASLTITNTGDVQTNAGSVGSWITPTSAAGSAYEARVTMVSGDTLTGGTLNTWLSLGTSRAWSLSTTIVGTVIGTATVEIRQASSGTVLASRDITWTATKSL